VYNGIWLAVALGVIHNTDLLAKKALERFAPLVRDKAKELEVIRYRMTTMPARTVFWLYSFFAVVLLVGAIQDPSFVIFDEIASPIPPLTFVISAFWGVTSYSMATVMVYHTVRQLTLVTEAYDLVEKVNVFHQQPLYAFSGLTMRTALFFVAQVYVTYASEAIYDPSSAEEVVNLALSAIIIPLAIAVVLLPLWGIHQRLMDAKTNVLEENSMQIANTRNTLYKAIDKKSYPEVQGLDSALGSLYKERDMLKTIPTWPWAAGAFRNFLSAILLPMVLWVLQTLVGRYL
jgi:hypothetical protein